MWMRNRALFIDAVRYIHLYLIGSRNTRHPAPSHFPNAKFVNIFHVVKVLEIGVLWKTRPFLKRNVSIEI